MRRKMRNRIIAMLMAVAMLTQLSTSVFAALRFEDDSVIAMYDEQGNLVESHTADEWAELYPYGIFAFKETQLILKEGAEDGTQTGTLTLYRIGGTEGRAEATVSLYPAVTQLEEDVYSYANAAGINDYSVTVEDAWNIAEYQPLGGSERPVYAGGALTDAFTYEEGAAEEFENLTGVTIYAPVDDAESYKWQLEERLFDVTSNGWEDIDGADSAEFVIPFDVLARIIGGTYAYDFRCEYVVDGVTYCTDTWLGEEFDASADLPPVMPEDFVLDTSRHDSEIIFDGEEFDNYYFDVVFAEDEWEKEITFTIRNDELHECEEILGVVLSSSRGAQLNKSACTATVVIEDDEPQLPSEIGFESDMIFADKCDGKVRIPVGRVSEGLQYIVGAAYTVSGVTAEAGRDFVAEDGTALFVSDMDYTYIEIELVDDKIPLSKAETELCFTVTLTEAMGAGSTLAAGKEEITVYLYNSTEKVADNIASELYSSDELDVSSGIGETGAIVPSSVGSVVADEASTTGADAAAVYSLTGESSTFTYTYPGTLTFPDAYGDSYWSRYAQLAAEDIRWDDAKLLPYIGVSAGGTGEEIRYFEGDDHEGYIKNGTTLWKNNSGNIGDDGTGIRSVYNKGGLMELTIPNLYERYKQVTLNVNSTSDNSSGIYAGDDSSTLLFRSSLDPSGSPADYLINDYTGDNRWQSKSFTSSFSDDYDKLSFEHSYWGSWPEGDATSKIELWHGFLERRTIPLPILRIHTADDDYLQENAASLHETIKPVVTLVAGKGGVTEDGTKLWANSQLQVTRGNNASSYTYAKPANGSLESPLFYSWEDASGNTVRYELAAVSMSGEVGTLNLLGDGNERTQGYVNVVMDRSQKLSLEIAPSVARIDGTNDIDPDQIGETWDALFAKITANGYSGISYTYREVDWDFSAGNDGFSDEKVGTLTKGQLTASDTLFSTASALKNVRSVNFHLNPDDVIVVNGLAYAGDADIPIPANQFLNDNITFYYYDAEYVTGINTMLATISRIERYIDLNDDGIVEGSINPTTGEFVPGANEIPYDPTSPDNVGATYYTLESVSDGFYSISQMAPRYDESDVAHQIILKVYYTMLPRSLVVPEGSSEADTAEVIPTIVTAVTTPSERAKMTSEELGYRYINHGGSGADKLMYTAKASQMSFVDLPLGGDFGTSSASRNTSTGEESITWKPVWKGNPYDADVFADASPIYLDETLLGDNYPVGETDDSGALTAAGVETVRAYLSSMQANDTFTLCVRETPKPDTTGYALFAEPVQYLEGIESSRLSGMRTYPSSDSARTLSDPLADGEKHTAGFDSSQANNPMSEYDMAGDINLPEMELGVSDFVSIAINGQEMALSVGANLWGLKSESAWDDQENMAWGDRETNAGKAANSDAIDSLKQVWNSLTRKKTSDPNDPNSVPTKSDETHSTIGSAAKEEMTNFEKAIDEKDNIAAFGDPNKNHAGIRNKSFEINLAVNLTILLKWDPLESKFMFNQIMITIVGGLELSYTVHLTPCPAFYCCFTFGISLEIAFGLEASRIKVIDKTVDFNERNITGNLSGWSYYENQKHMGHDDLDEPENGDFLVGDIGAYLELVTNKKALDVYFTGTLYVDAKDSNGNRPEGFYPGTIYSAGDEAVTIKLAKQVDGKNNDRDYTVTLKVVDSSDDYVRYVTDSHGNPQELDDGEAIVDKIVTIERQTHDVYFSGVSISPELFFEAAVGITVIIAKAELYLNASVGCSLGFAVHDSADYYGEESETSPFELNEFSFVAGLGFRFEALFFSYEFSAVQFTITYDRETKYDEDTNKKTGWNFMWYAANRPVGSYAMDDDPLEVTVILPGMKERDEVLYTPEENLDTGASTFAFDPSDTSVPFQYSGYGSSGDAFTLGSDLTLGSTYEIVTANDKNYIVYTVTRENAVGDIHDTQLVLSEIRETVDPDEPLNSAYGLSHPLGEPGAYLALDNDTFGDLDFDVWVDGDEIRVAWVSYTDKASDAYESALNLGGNSAAEIAIHAQAAAGQQTEVKAVTIDVVNSTAGAVEIVSDNKADHGMYYVPSGAGDMVFYAEAAYYDPTELAKLISDYSAFYGTPSSTQDSTSGMYYGTDDPSGGYQLAIKQLRAEVYGKSFYPTYAVKTAYGYAVSRVKSDYWLENAVALDNVDITKIGDDYYAAYSTSQAKLKGEDEETIKKLYLQKIELGTDGKPAPESPVALRNALNMTKDSSKDGLYSNGSLTEAYEDPYFANVKFLRGKLGGLSGDSESFTEQIAISTFAVQAESFMIFEMNGNTYVIPEASLKSITDSGVGQIIPFFGRNTAEEVANAQTYFVETTPAVTNVTFGVDGSGNIAAVYTRGEKGIPGNAVYLTKFDPESLTWGVGTRLAMRDMDTAEQGEAEGWTADEISTAFHDTNGDGVANTEDSPSSFTFNKIRIGLAGTDKLLVVTEGTLLELGAVAKQKATIDSQGNFTGIEADKDGDTQLYSFNAKLGSSGYESKSGIYAISFGMGERSLGSAAIHLSNYNLANGSQMRANVSFVNDGDVAIRASEQNPAKVTLFIGETEYASWLIKENVRAGQEVITTSQSITLHDVELGDKLYFSVSEDASYVGANAFAASTETAVGEPDTPACITIDDRVELGYESFDIAMVSADGNSVTLAPDIQVGNRGSADSDITYLRFQYETVDKNGVRILAPVDLTGHRLTVSEQFALTYDDTYTLEKGYLLLRTTQDGVEVEDAAAGQIKSMHGRSVTGMFSVPKSCYDTEYGTGSLNLLVTIESYNTSLEQNVEYNPSNNVKEFSVEPKTIFSTVHSVDMQVGTTLRLPVTMQTSTETAPTVTMTELTDDGVKNLSVLYYDANQGAIVVMAAREGEGRIRIADTATSSFHDICYNVEGEGVELNIYDDNGIFTWYDKNGGSGDAGHDAWDFNSAYSWPSSSSSESPLRGDLAVATAGESFSFETFATELKLKFLGDIEVTTNLAGFGEQSFSSSDGTTAVAIDFNNDESIAHTVTIKATSDSVWFDCLEEVFEDDRVIKSDPTAPGIYFSRTLPETASIEAVTDAKLTLTVYFADLGGLAAVTYDGLDMSSRLVKDGDELWSLELDFTANGSHSFVVTDMAGNTTTRALSVDWFSATAPTNRDPGAPEITAALVDESGAPTPALIPGDMRVSLQVTDATGAVVEAELSSLEYSYGGDGNPTSQYLKPFTSSLTPSVGYEISGGIYRAAVSENGVTSYRFVNLDELDTSYPKASLALSSDGSALIVTAEKNAAEGQLTPITSVKLNNLELLPSGTTTYRFTTTVPADYSGDYILTVTDEAGNEVSSLTVSVPETARNAVKLGSDAVTTTKVTENGDVSNSDGTVTIDLDKLSGGSYDSAASAAQNKPQASYEFALISAEQGTPTASDWTALTPDANNDVTIENLDAGEYLLFIRDANNPASVAGPIEITVELLRVIISNVTSTRTHYRERSGTVGFEATGGYGELEYEISNGGDTKTSSVPLFEGLAAGDYTLTARDSSNPSNFASVRVTVVATYTVTVADGYSTKSGSGEYAAGELVKIDAGTRPSYSFDGWSADEDVKISSDSFVMPARNVTVTAKWLRNMILPPFTAQFTLSFETDGGSEIADVTELFGTTVDLTEILTEREGFEFVGWYADEALTEKIISLELTTDMTVYAAWNEISTETPDVEPFVNPYSDVSESDWFYSDVMYAYVNGLMNGTGGDLFSPELTTTRGMIVTVLHRLEGEPVVNYAMQFEDVGESQWYTESVRWAASEGIVEGYGNGCFGPNDQITREQTATILWRYARYKDCDVTSDEAASLEDFEDGETVSVWAAPAMSWAVSKGIIGGYAGYLNPTGSAKRSEVAAILHRFCTLDAE